jgi:hypothetical protein
LIRSLLTLPVTTDEHGDAVAQVVRLSDEAQAVFDKFEHKLEPRLGEFGDLAVVTEWGSKLAGGVGRIAGLLHAVEQVDYGLPWDTPISEATMASAITLAEEFLIPHAMAAFGHMGVDPVLEDARYLRRWLGNKQIASITKKKLHEGTKGRFKTVRDLEPAIALLKEHGYLVERRSQSVSRKHPQGRKPSPVYDVVLD